jgi:hypothetical protein
VAGQNPSTAPTPSPHHTGRITAHGRDGLCTGQLVAVIDGWEDWALLHEANNGIDRRISHDAIQARINAAELGIDTDPPPSDAKQVPGVRPTNRQAVPLLLPETPPAGPTATVSPAGTPIVPKEVPVADQHHRRPGAVPDPRYRRPDLLAAVSIPHNTTASTDQLVAVTERDTDAEPIAPTAAGAHESDAHSEIDRCLDWPSTIRSDEHGYWN